MSVVYAVGSFCSLYSYYGCKLGNDLISYADNHTQMVNIISCSMQLGGYWKEYTSGVVVKVWN